MDSKPKEEDRKLFNRLAVARRDFEIVLRCAHIIRKEGWHHSQYDRMKRPVAYFHQTVYMTSLVVTYARPFTKSEGWPDFPGRMLRIYDAEERQLHATLLSWRDEIYAHSDSKHLDVWMVASANIKLEGVIGPDLRFMPEQLTKFVAMVEKLDKTLLHRTDELHDEV
ncbi:hypothetical protein [Roseococcus sp.]|uniref:hypothetical protein n=1 Tax=Roseococcus sp. TaxID=2109646 RepID=UPI003BAA8204